MTISDSKDIESLVKEPRRQAKKISKHLRRKKKRKTRESIDQYTRTVDSITDVIRD